MNNGISFAIGSVLGTVVGCVGTYVYFKKKEDDYIHEKNEETEKYINEEIKKVIDRKEEKFKKEVMELKEIIEEQKQSILEQSAIEAKDILPNNDYDEEEHIEYHNIFEDSELQKNDTMKKYMSRGNSIEKAVLINEDTFIDKEMELDPKTNVETYEVANLVYYKGDDIVCEDDDNIISPEIYGLSKSMFVGTTENALYFALSKTKILIRVVIVDESYEETHYETTEDNYD